MADAKELTFETNANKDYLRSVLNRRLIEAWARASGQRLQYLGLPGPKMLDIIEWQEFLDCFTTIERREHEQHRLFLSANVRDVEHRLHSLYGEFDEILISGRDRYGQMPRWPYDLVNLDFYGGLLYSNLARPKALKKLIANQEAFRRSFLLVITYHLRDNDLAKEKLGFLDDLEKKLVRDVPSKRGRVEEVMAWYRNPASPDSARQTLYLNSFLHDNGEAAQFEVLCRPSILYSGTGGARMIHLVTDFQYQKGAHRAVSSQSALDVLNLGVRELASGELSERVAVPRV